jgi:hypothetical protein
LREGIFVANCCTKLGVVYAFLLMALLGVELVCRESLSESSSLQAELFVIESCFLTQTNFPVGEPGFLRPCLCDLSTLVTGGESRLSDRTEDPVDMKLSERSLGMP